MCSDKVTQVQKMLCAMLHSVSFVHGKMHSDWFNGIEILQGRWQHGEKVGYCYPRGLEKILFKWDIYVRTAGHERVKNIFFFYFCIFHIIIQSFDILTACKGRSVSFPYQNIFQRVILRPRQTRAINYKGAQSI
jgi:hypothetical protein